VVHAVASASSNGLDTRVRKDARSGAAERRIRRAGWGAGRSGLFGFQRLGEASSEWRSPGALGSLVLISRPEEDDPKAAQSGYGGDDSQIAKSQRRVMLALLLVSGRTGGAAVGQHRQWGPAVVHRTVGGDPKRQEEHEAERNDDDDAYRDDYSDSRRVGLGRGRVDHCRHGLVVSCMGSHDPPSADLARDLCTVSC
jgi:hypothetical protein